MKKELIICIIIIGLIIIMNIIAQKFTIKSIEMMNIYLSNLEKEILENENEKEISNKITKIDEEWHKMQDKLSFYIEHDELEKVETRIANIKGMEKVEKYDDILPQIEECSFLLEHIRDKNTLILRNIF